MRITALVLLGLAFGSPAFSAQGYGNNRSNAGVPPGHLPRPGECRVWYDGVPPGRQPPPTDCRTAERVADRDRNARVIYGDSRAVGRRLPNNSRYPDRGGRYANDLAWDNGYRDGLEKGREDARDRDVYDPSRHKRYRSGDHGYSRSYGLSKDEYKGRYRQGFIEGYEVAYERPLVSGRRGPGVFGRR